MTKELTPLNIAVLTVSDTRTLDTDTSGSYLQQALEKEGHHLADRKLVIDDVYQMRAIVSAWIADPEVEVILTTGGTGIGPRDITPDVVNPMLDKELPGIMEFIRVKHGERLPSATNETELGILMAGMDSADTNGARS